MESETTAQTKSTLRTGCFEFALTDLGKSLSEPQPRPELGLDLHAVSTLDITSKKIARHRQVRSVTQSILVTGYP